MEKRKVPIQKRALLARIRRKLKRDDQDLHISKSQSEILNLGEYYATEGSCVVWSHKTLEELARELNCLKEYERLDEGEEV